MATLPEHRFTSQFLNATFQQGLAHWNRQRLAPAFPSEDWRLILDGDAKMLRLEGAFLEELRAEVAEEAAAAPRDPASFLAWFEALNEAGAGQGDPLFLWLAAQASLEQMKWFLRQEAAGEAG